MAAKVNGAASLMAATSRHHLTFAVLYSSLSAQVLLLLLGHVLHHVEVVLLLLCSEQVSGA